MFPKLLDLGPIPIHTYGLMLALAFLSATALLAYLAEKDGIPRSRAWDLGFVVILSALAGAKILMVLTNLNYYLSQPSRFLALEFWQAGGAFFGGLIGATLAAFLFIRLDKNLSFWKVADAVAPAIALGQAIGRLGCFAAGCDYGTPSNLPWAVTFTSQYAHDNVGVPLNIAVHPVQLYESFSTMLLFVALLFWLSRRTFHGQIICGYFIGYGLIRFFVEFFRGDTGRGFVMDNLLSIPQVLSLLALAVGLVAYFSIRSRRLEKGRV
jgi:phosphatidylglycerol:prolipoprotein diacylglycerol transferase